MSALSADKLTFGYGGKRILDGFSCTIAAGEHSLLLGPSGSGKTTLINLLTGLLTPDTGEIRIDGALLAGSVAERDKLRRQKIGIIFQTLRLVEALSVTANLRLAQKLAGRARDDAEIAALLDDLGIAHRAHARPRALSQGEGQRAAVARALVTRPSLLIADEPTSALDDANAEKIASLLLKAASDHGSTLLIATHDQRIKHHFPNTVMLANPAEVA